MPTKSNKIQRISQRCLLVLKSPFQDPKGCARYALLLVTALVVWSFSSVPTCAQVTILHSFGDGSVADDGGLVKEQLIQGSDGNLYGVSFGGGSATKGAIYKVVPGSTPTILHSFGDGSITNDGENPVGILQASDGNFYGTTVAGGSSSAGTIFKMTSSGVVTILHNFTGGTDGEAPEAGLVQGTDGNFYGTTSGGGGSTGGIVFKVTPTGTETVLYAFGATGDGSDCVSPLVQGSDGNFYGTTAMGGSSDEGIVFQITPTGTETVLHDFGDGSVTNDGSNPFAGLIQGADSNFYGTTNEGGSAGHGTVFKITSTGTLTIVHSFSDGTVTNDGMSPQANLVFGPEGTFYGLTEGGGSASYGTIYRVTPSGKVTIIHSFGDGSVTNDGASPQQGGLALGANGILFGTTYAGGSASDGVLFQLVTYNLVQSLSGPIGSSPEGGLIQASDGNFYGITVTGGTANAGSVFKIASGVESVLHSFGDGSVTNDGQSPEAALVQGADGNLYGVTNAGGTASKGTAFKITTSGTVTILHSFGDGSVTNDGQSPTNVLVIGSDGNFYGTTLTGGSAGKGAAFKMTTSGTVTILHNFGDGSVTNDAQYPAAGLWLATDGNFYGTATAGGSASEGAVFEMTSSGAVIILHSFGDGSVTNDGISPDGGLIQASDGNFYGTTLVGGSASEGTAYQITTGGTLTILHHFGSVTNDGAYPVGSMVQGSDGNLYGTTAIGGTASGGAGFKMTTSGTTTILHNFVDGSVTNDGDVPVGNLIQATDGKFYGVTLAGGSSQGGTAFNMSSSGTVTILYSFGVLSSGGSAPYGNLIQGSDGNYYGTTSGGGIAGDGTVFKITPTGVITVLHNFGDGSVLNDGQVPYGALVQASDGNFYGTTTVGGSANVGAAFKMTSGGTLTILHSFGDGSVTNDGQAPNAAFIQATDGNLYSTTAAGGSAGDGTVFKMTTSGTVTILHHFNDGSISNDGQSPYSSLIQATDGNFYGTTNYGGAVNDGIVFLMTTSGTVTVLHSFGDGSVTNDGESAYSGVVQGNDGNLYGTTLSGGSGGQGVVYSCTTSGTVTILHSFGDGSVTNDGSGAWAGLMMGLDGNFYGTTLYGGAGSDSLGTIFKITPAGVVTIVHSFEDGSVPNDGELPVAGLTLGSDGSAYGTTFTGGSGGNGSIFKF